MGYRQGKNPFSKSPLNFSSPLNSFDSLVGKLMNQGKSKEAATKIAGKVANAKMKGAGSGPTAAQKARSKGSAAKMADESPLDKELVGNQKNLPDHLKNAIEAAPESPAKMKSPIKAHGKKLKALEKRIEKVRNSKEGSEGQGGIDYELLSELEAQKKQMIESHDKQAKETKDSPAKMKDERTGRSHSEMSDKEKGKHMKEHLGTGARKPKKPTRPEASKRTADQLNAKDPIKGSPAKQKGGRGDHSKMTDGEYSRHLASPKGKKEHGSPAKMSRKTEKKVGEVKKEKRKPNETITEFRDRISGKPNPDVNFRKGAKKKAVSRKPSPAKADGAHRLTNEKFTEHIHKEKHHRAPSDEVIARRKKEGKTITGHSSDIRPTNTPPLEMKKKSPLNNAYENPQYIQPTKSSYGQDMDNFFDSISNAYEDKKYGKDTFSSLTDDELAKKGYKRI